MSRFLSSEEAPPKRLETTQELIGLLEVLTRLYSLTKRELGSKRAQTITTYALATTYFHNIPFTENGFDLSQEHAKEQFTSLPQTVRRDQYHKAIAIFFTQLSLYLGQEQSQAIFANVTRLAKPYGIDVSMALPHTNRQPQGAIVSKIGAFFMGLASMLGRTFIENHAQEYQATIVSNQDEMLHQLSVLTDVFYALPEATLVIDTNHNVLFANAQAQELLGKAQFELIGKPITKVLTLIENNQLLTPQVYLSEVPVVNNHILYIGNRLLLKTPERKNMYVNMVAIRPLQTFANEIAGILTLYPVGALTDVQRNQLDVVSITAHELKSPLTSMRGYLAILEDELGSKLSKDQLVFLTRTSVATNQIITLIENLLAFAKIENKTLSLQKFTTTYEDLVEKAIEDVSSNALTKRITVTFKKPQEALPKVTVDGIRMVEVLTNLLSNAINFSPAGSTVTVAVFTDNGFLVTEVKDHGVGIPEEAIPKLFTKFYQVPQDNPQEMKGTGLGLYIAKEIITAHGGTIWVQSELNKGSTFAFRLPLSDKKTDTAAKEHTNEATNHRYFHSQGTPLVPLAN